jgi:TonB family protein
MQRRLSGIRIGPTVIWSKLTRMSTLRLPIRSLAILIVLTCAMVKSAAQSGGGAGTVQGEALLTKLSDPLYPRLARQARISGDVQLTLEVKADGSVQSAIVVSGHPILKQAALQSVEQSQFECRRCPETGTSLQLLYTFQLVEMQSCCRRTEDDPKNIPQDESIPRVIQTRNHVTVVDQPTCICDPAADIRGKVRSLKCLYLWRCGFPRLVIYE